MVDLFQKVKQHQEQQLPFVVFCKPNSDKIIGLFQKDAKDYFIENFDEKGFVFAPFNGSKIPYIPVDESHVYVEKVSVFDFYLESKTDFVTNEDAQSDFEKLVQKGIDAIQLGSFQKVVLSRKESVAISNFDIEKTFKKLLANYSTAFKYCFFNPKIGLWLGATPEQFLKVSNNEIQTVAIAGTQVFDDKEEVIWEAKEKQEQEFVTDFIVDGLKEYVAEVAVSNPYTVRAGNIMHIKTNITATLNNSKNLKPIIKALHPTPAVCGLPKATAKDFIIENERYEREYYSGFLGELNIDLATFKTEQTDLFVNLRCMKIVEDIAELFIGCGITKDSNPGKEYIETVNKSLTMKKVL